MITERIVYVAAPAVMVGVAVILWLAHTELAILDPLIKWVAKTIEESK